MESRRDRWISADGPDDGAGAGDLVRSGKRIGLRRFRQPLMDPERSHLRAQPGPAKRCLRTIWCWQALMTSFWRRSVILKASISNCQALTDPTRQVPTDRLLILRAPTGRVPRSIPPELRSSASSAETRLPATRILPAMGGRFALEIRRDSVEEYQYRCQQQQRCWEWASWD